MNNLLRTILSLSVSGSILALVLFAETQRLFDLWGFIQRNLLWLWLAGAIISFGWFSVAYTVFSRRIWHSCTAPHGDDLAVFEHLRGDKRVRLLCSSYITTPIFTGVLHPVIVLPQFAYIRNNMGEELRHILCHELTHYRRKDVLYKWLVVMVTSLHWFNPLMILVRKEIGRACELSCDETVISNMFADERQFYGNMLLSLATNKKLSADILATTLCEDKKELKERLINIKHYKKKSTLVDLLTLMLALLLSGCAAALGVVNNAAVFESNISSEVSEDVNASDIIAEKLLSEGTSISYTISAENENWTRHVDFEERNDPAYLERFPDLEALQAKYAGHTLFEMPRGASESVTFYTELGLGKENISNFSPDPQFFRILIINSKIKDVKVLDNQVAIVAEPADSGYQVITHKSDNLPDNTVFRLVTPAGKEIDRLSDSTLVAAIPLPDIEPYEAPEVEITTEGSSDIASVIVSYDYGNGTEVLFYRAQNGDIFGAYQVGGGDGDVIQFTQGYWADDGFGNQEGYQSGYNIKSYENVFGHDGFYIVCPRGAAYDAYDYYCFEPDGTLKLLVQCSNYVVENDINGDGQKELLCFYHGYPNNGGAGMASYYFERDGQIFKTNLDSVLGKVFPNISFPGSYFTSADDISVLYFEYHLNGDKDNTHEFELKFTEDSIMVYSKTDEEISISEQNNVWLPESGVLLASLPDDNIAIYGDKDNLSEYGDFMKDCISPSMVSTDTLNGRP